MVLAELDISGSMVCHNVPEQTGVYIVTDAGRNVLYVGSTNCLRRRIAYLEAHVRDKSGGGFTHDASDLVIHLQETGQNVHLHYIACADYKARETLLKKKYRPAWNKDRW